MSTVSDPNTDRVVQLLRQSGLVSTQVVADKLGLPVQDARYLLTGLWDTQVVGHKKVKGIDCWHLVGSNPTPTIAGSEPAVEFPHVKLAPAVPKLYMITDLMALRSRKELDLKPYFQREVVWKLHAQGYLIESVMRGFPVPEIFVHRNEQTKRLEVLDGQQRLTAIFEFADGHFEVAGIGSFESLSPDARKFFLQYPIAVREVGSLSDDMIRELFRRLNTNVVPLSAQELRHARFSGRFIRMVEELAKESYWLANMIVTEDEDRRMRTAEFVSELIVAMKEGVQKGRYHLTEFYEAYEQEFTEKVEAVWRAKFSDTFSTFRAIMGDVRKSPWRKKEDFYALFLALYRLSSLKLKLPDRKYGEVAAPLFSFREKVVKERSEPGTDPNVRLYAETVRGGIGNRDKRELRINILYNMIMPFCEVRSRRDD